MNNNGFKRFTCSIFVNFEVNNLKVHKIIQMNTKMPMHHLLCTSWYLCDCIVSKDSSKRGSSFRNFDLTLYFYPKLPAPLNYCYILSKFWYFSCKIFLHDASTKKWESPVQDWPRHFAKQNRSIPSFFVSRFYYRKLE